MTRQAARGVVLLVLIAAVLDSTGRAQPPMADTIYYRDRKDKDGAVANWAVEMGPPNALLRRGWKKSSIRSSIALTQSASRRRASRSRDGILPNNFT